MSELSLKAVKRSTTPLVINLDTDGTVVSHRYDVAKLSGKAAFRAQLTMAEFAKDPQRDQIVGSQMFAEILAGTTPVGDTPALLDLFDQIGNDGLEPLLQALLEAATSSTVGA